MKINSFYTFWSLFFWFCFTYAWGPTGHRVVGEVASKHIKKRTLRKISKILDYESLASASTFADEIRSDDRYKKFAPWHYVNFPFGMRYEDMKKAENGDIIFAVNECKRIILDEDSADKEKAFYLKLLIHFIGDLHMPLHVGRAEDWGGNKIKVTWFKKDSNLHKVWDEDMIDQYGMSYTEFANNLPSLSKSEKKEIQSTELMDWVYESQNLAQEVYASAQDGDKLWYPYHYYNFGTVETQLQKAGLRLAKVLDELF